jgi:hypothetical protein
MEDPRLSRRNLSDSKKLSLERASNSDHLVLVETFGAAGGGEKPNPVVKDLPFCTHLK